jgi:LPXTG-motif cell wall-anchored protein
MSDDDYIVDEESGNSGRRSFLIAASVLGLVFVLATICSVGFLLAGRSASNPQATAIAATNSVILITNEAVTVAINATNTALAQPTNTPEPTSQTTNTPAAVSDTATPTGTSVVEVAASDTPTPNLSGTSTFDDNENENADDNANENASDNENENDAANDNNAADDSTATPLPNGTIGDGNGSLPNTGSSNWLPIAIALVLIGLLVGARRLRNA